MIRVTATAHTRTGTRASAQALFEDVCTEMEANGISIFYRNKSSVAFNNGCSARILRLNFATGGLPVGYYVRVRGSAEDAVVLNKCYENLFCP
jgi:hypothetical protein